MIFLIFLLALSASINIYFATNTVNPVIKYVEYTPGWISDRQPEDNDKRVIVYFQDRCSMDRIQSSTPEYDRYGNLICWGNKVKCWMPMPKPPKERGE